MWWVIGYFIIVYFTFTLLYFYLEDTYESPVIQTEFWRSLYITICSLLLGLFWIFIPIVFIIYKNQSKQK